MKVDSVGNIYVADSNNHRVQARSCMSPVRFRLSLLGAAALDAPRVPAVSPAGPLRTKQSGAHPLPQQPRTPWLRPSWLALPCLQKFDRNFNSILQFGSFGAGDGQVRGTLGSEWQHGRAQIQ